MLSASLASLGAGPLWPDMCKKGDKTASQKFCDQSLSLDERAKALVGAMTLEEKMLMLHGPPTGPSAQCWPMKAECAYVGNVQGMRGLDCPSRAFSVLWYQLLAASTLGYRQRVKTPRFGM